MKKLYPKSKSSVFKLCLILLSLIAVIYGCKKDVFNSTNQPDQKDQSAFVEEAKTWFETNASINKEQSLATNSVGSNYRKWIEGLNPDWSKTMVYAKDKGTIIEMPLFSSAVSFLMHTTDGSRATQQNNYTKATYIIQKDSLGVFKGWFMVLVADTAYVNGDFSKFDKNTYQSKDAAYSGRLLYYNLSGKFLAGWKYDNGVITNTLSLADPVVNQQQVNGQKIKVNLVQTCETYAFTTVTWECIAVNFNNSNPDWIPTCTPYYTTTYLTQCTTQPGGGDSGGGGGTGGGGQGPGTFPPPPPQPDCPTMGVASVGGQHVNLLPGGGGTPPTVPDDPCAVNAPEDPCAQAKKKAQDPTFKAKMNDLKSKVGLLNEVGYTVDANSNYSYVQGQPGAASISLTINAPISTYIHTHYTGTFPTFSGSDIKAIYDLQQIGKIADINTFTAGVVTASGTTYLIKINDPAKFAAFGSANFNNTANFANFEQSYSLNQNSYAIAGNNNVTSYELALLKTLTDSGLTILKGNDTFSSWNTMTKTGSNIMTDIINIINCNL